MWEGFQPVHGGSFSASGFRVGSPHNDPSDDHLHDSLLDDLENAYWEEHVHLEISKRVHALRQEC